MNQTTTTANSSSWTGWHRPAPGTRWRAVVHADSEDAAFRQLLDSVPGGDKTVLPHGHDPNLKPAYRRRCF